MPSVAQWKTVFGRPAQRASPTGDWTGGLRERILSESEVGSDFSGDRASSLSAHRAREPKQARLSRHINQRTVYLRQMLQAIGSIEQDLMRSRGGSGRLLRAEQDIESLLLGIVQGILAR